MNPSRIRILLFPVLLLWGIFETNAQGYPALYDTLEFCQGDVVTINGIAYTRNATARDTLPATAGRPDLPVTYYLCFSPPPARTETIAFRPGDTVFIQGLPYWQPTAVQATVPSAIGGCDTLVTYVLLRSDERPGRAATPAHTDFDRSERTEGTGFEAERWAVFPNPSCGVLTLDLTPWNGRKIEVEVWDGQGRPVDRRQLTAGAEPLEFRLSPALPNGTYSLKIIPADRPFRVARFVLQQ
jgi:hypothetical protein